MATKLHCELERICEPKRCLQMFAVSQIVSDCLRFCWCIILPAAGSKLPTVLRVLAADAAGCADVEKVGALSQ